MAPSTSHAASTLVGEGIQYDEGTEPLLDDPPARSSVFIDLEDNMFVGHPIQGPSYNNLHVVSIGKNNISSIFLSKYLISLNMNKNQISGPFPLEVSTMQALNSLKLHNSQITVWGGWGSNT